MVSPRGLIMNHSKEQKLGMPLLTSSDKDRDVYFGVYLENMRDVLFWQVFSTLKKGWWWWWWCWWWWWWWWFWFAFNSQSLMMIPITSNGPTRFRSQVPLSHAEHLAVLPPAQYSSGQIETPRRSDCEGAKYWDDSALWVLQHVGSSGGCDQESSLVI